MHSIDINILVGNSLTSLEEGKDFLKSLYKSYPELYPERFGSYEPLRNMADPSDHEHILEICNNDIHWKRRRPKVEGSLLTAWGPRPFHGRFAISIRSDKIITDNLEQLIIDLSRSFEIHFATVHELSPPDIQFNRSNETLFKCDPSKSDYFIINSTKILRRYIPDLYWLTVFGKPYVEFFGKEHLLSAPAPFVKEINEDVICIKLSENPCDIINDYDAVNSVREKVKKHLNNNAFYDPTAIPEHLYNVPDFKLQTYPQSFKRI